MNTKTPRFVVRTLILVFGLGLFAQAQAITVPGSTQGSLTVSPAGAAQYAIPLTVPPGVGGVVPQLAMQYSSQGDNGLLGVGWSLGGLYSINRCPQTQAQDAARTGVTITADDRFCLNGKRLILVTGTYGANNAEYRTEIDEFSRIVSYTSVAVRGPDYFKAWTRDGRIIEFGNTTDSKLIANKTTTTADASAPYGYINTVSLPVAVDAKLLQWSANKVSDRNSNFYTITYTKNDLTSESYPDRIQYTGNDVIGQPLVVPANEVKFVYEVRPTLEDNATLADYPLQFIGGSKVLPAKRLKEVQLSADGVLARKYTLAYEVPSVEAMRSLLESVTECAYTVSGVESCYSPTRFDMSKFGACLYDSVVSQIAVVEPILVGGDGTFVALSADFNGDGRTDLASAKIDDGGFAILSSWSANAVPSGTDFVETRACNTVHTKPGQSFVFKGISRIGVSVATGNSPYWTLVSGDVTGDGIADVVAIPFIEPLNPVVAVSQANGSFIRASASPADTSGYSSDAFTFGSVALSKKIDPPRLADVNGDGKLDVVAIKWVSATTRAIFYRQGVGDGTFLPTIRQDLVIGLDDNPKERGSFIGDVDGDGRADLVFVRLHSGVIISDVLRGIGDNPAVFQAAVESPLMVSALFGNALASGGKRTGMDLLDINRDGMSDLVFVQVLKNSTTSNSTGYGAAVLSALGTSTGSFVAPDANLSYETPLPDIDTTEDLGSVLWHTKHADINGDGRLDLAITRVAVNTALNKNRLYGVFFANRGDGRYIGYAAGWVTAPAETLSSDGAWAHLTGDLDGDGLGDLALVQTNNVADFRTFPVFPRPSLPDLLIKVTDGNGSVTELVQAPLTRDEVYTKGAATFPEIAIRAPLYVVKTIKSDSGNSLVGGVTSYKYAGAKVDLNGRGFLGFVGTEVTDSLGIITTTTFSQTFPWTGMPTNVTSKSGTVTLSSATNTLDKKIITHASGKFSYIPFVASTTASQYEYTSGGILVSQSVTDNTLDTWGNQLTSATTTTGDTSTYTRSVTNTYYANTVDATTWRIGDLNTQTDRRTGPLPGGTTSDLTRTVSLAYDAVGLVATTDIEPSNPALRVTSTLTRDRFGNVLTKTTTGSDIATRVEQTTYDASGRFPVSSTNAEGQVVSPIVTDARFGTPLSVKDPNGVYATRQYDNFGRVTREQVKQTNPDNSVTDGPYADVVYLACDASCVTTQGEAFMVKTTRVGVTPVYVYYDRNGRERRTLTKGMDNRDIIVATEYDNLGRVARTSKPYYSGDTIYWTTRTYDVVGRMSTEVLPASRTTTMTYNARVTTITNPKSQVTKKTVDSLGRLITTTDAANMVQTFAYDAFGNVVRSTDAAGNIIVNQYDLLGRKTQQQDPDLGTWNYDHDVLGQLIWQQDGKSQISTFAYDKLGRPLSRSEPDLISTWTWDTATRGIGKLAKLAGDNGFERNYHYDGFGRPVQSITKKAIDPNAQAADPDFVHSTTYDSAGRPEAIAYPTGFGYKNIYDANGYLSEIRRKDNNAVLYWRANTRDAEGHVTRETLGNGLVTDRKYKADTSYLDTVQTGTLSGSTLTASVQNDVYGFDALGNLNTRSQYFGSTSLTETFAYDNLNRMTSVTPLGGAAKTATYDVLGNITNRSDVGTYTYAGCGGAHRVCNIAGAVNADFTYYDPNDGPNKTNGNMLSGNGRSLTWTSYNYPLQITQGTVTETFLYTPERERVRRTSVEGGQTTTTVYLNPRIDLGGTFEKTYKPDNTVEYTHHVYAGSQVIGSVVTVAGGAAASVAEEARVWSTDLAEAPTTINPNPTGLTESTDPQNLVSWGAGREAFNARAAPAPQAVANLTGQRTYVPTQAVGMQAEVTTTANIGAGRYLKVLARTSGTSENGSRFGVLFDGNNLSVQAQSGATTWTQPLTAALQSDATYVVKVETGSGINKVSVEALTAESWGTPGLIETNDAGDATVPQVAYDGNGNAIAVWQQPAGGGGDCIWANRYVAGTGWGVAQLIGTSGDRSADPQIAIDSNGNAIAVWQQGNDIWANRYVAGTGWGVAQLIETSGGGAKYPQIAIDSNGNAVVIWPQSDGTRFNIWANRYVAGTGWGVAQLIETSDGVAEDPQIATDSNGNAIAVWQQTGDIWANRYVAGNGWGVAQLIEAAGAKAKYPQIAIDSNGNAVAVWQQSDGTRNNIYANRYVAGTGWGVAQLIETSDDVAEYPQIAIDSNGNAVVIWPQPDGTRFSIWANRYVAGTGWGVAQLIETSDGVAEDPQIATDSNGNAIAVWQQGGIWANRYVAGIGWGMAQPVATNNTGSASAPQIAIDSNGNAIAVWQQPRDGSRRQDVWANRYTPASTRNYSYSTTSGQIAWDADSTGRTRALVIETATRVVTNGSTTSNITYVDNLVETQFFPGERTRYFHTDHLGSLTVVTDGQGNVIERMSYDAWGKRRNPSGSDDTASTLKGANTKHGFTLHEHLDSIGLVHMNGRVYDPLVGRFVSADPNVFYPTNMQDFNRYSYVHNNPLSYTDPSGFLTMLDDPAMSLWGHTTENNFLSGTLNLQTQVDRYGTQSITFAAYSYNSNIQQSTSSFTVTIASGGSGNQYSGTGVATVNNSTSTGNRNDGGIEPGLSIRAADPNQMYVDVADIYRHPSFLVAEHVSAAVWPSSSEVAVLQTAADLADFTVPPVDYINFSGGPQYGIPPFFGDLIGDIYRPTDLLSDPANTWRANVYVPVGVTPDEFASRLLAATLNYNTGRRVNYNLTPELTGNYNSGSYLPSLVEAAGGIIWPPLNGFPAVGSGVRMAPGHFGY